MAKPIRYGVFKWVASGVYREAEAIKVYRSQKVAQAYCDKRYPENIVVRAIY